MRKLNKAFVLLLIMMPAIGLCQQFSHSANIEGVPVNGFYSVTITPELSRHLHVSMKDLRIINGKGVQVPYLLKSSLPEINEQNFQKLVIVENNLRDSGKTHLVLENTSGKQIEEIALIVRNAAVNRSARISGSDDGKNWFTIAEDMQLANGYNSSNDRFVLNISFPLSSYRFFRLIINNLKNDPLNIMEARHNILFEWKRFNQLLENPACKFYQNDSSDGYSYIRVIQPAFYHISSIAMSVQEPKFYKRRMEVIAPGSFADFIISSSLSSSFSVPTFKDTTFLIRIFNGDNPPLKISGISTAQEKKKIIAYLENGQQYTVLAGNPAVHAPSYDIEAFTDSIPPVQTELKLLAIQEKHQNIKEAEKNKSSIYLWLIIIGVLGLLSFFTWNLTKELKKRNQ